MIDHDTRDNYENAIHGVMESGSFGNVGEVIRCVRFIGDSLMKCLSRSVFDSSGFEAVFFNRFRRHSARSSFI